MSRRRLSRAGGAAPAGGPVRLVHLGLGQFFRAHQAWYTGRAPDADAWGYAAFSGRSRRLVDELVAQNGLYTLVTRRPDRDTAEVVASVAEVHAGADQGAWRAAVASAATSVITLTVTEAAYCSAPGGGLDHTRADVAQDIDALQVDADATVTTVPARLVAGLDARRRAGSGPVSVVPCDNVPANGRMVGHVLADLANRVDPSLAEWIEQTVSVVSTVVDRITPRAGTGDGAVAAELTGWIDLAPVVTEPFSEWVLAGEFPAGRPRWEAAGATFVPDVTVYEQRKLWLLNGAHSLLAYAGSALGHTTVADAIDDERCRRWVEQWWATASPHLDQTASEIDAYCVALLERFANPRLHDSLARIAEDGSHKLPVRVLPVLDAERAAGRLPTAATFVLAAWLAHLRGSGAPVHDVRAEQLVALAGGPLDVAARRVLDALAPGLGEDADVVATVGEQVRELGRMARNGSGPEST